MLEASWVTRLSPSNINTHTTHWKLFSSCVKLENKASKENELDKLLWWISAMLICRIITKLRWFKVSAVLQELLFMSCRLSLCEVCVCVCLLIRQLKSGCPGWILGAKFELQLNFQWNQQHAHVYINWIKAHGSSKVYQQPVGNTMSSVYGEEKLVSIM